MKITFKTTMDGHRRGQSDLTLWAFDETAQKIGRIDYSEYKNVPKIKMIIVDDKFRRNGIATELAKELQREYPDTELDWGSLTNDGAAFIKSLKRKFVINKKYKKVKEELDLYKNKSIQLERIFEKWGKMFKGNKKLAEKLRGKMAKYNDLYHKLEIRIYELKNELSVEKEGKWLINV